MPSVDLKFEAYVVRATSSEPQDLAWLAAMLECGFEPADGAAPHAEVTLTIDAAAHDALLEGGRTETGPPVEAFAQDADRYVCEPWRADGGESVLRDPRLRGFYRLTDGGRAVEILVRAHTGACRHALMRVVRELTMDHVVATGAVLVHGAAVATERGAIVISGPKRHGKTTLLMSLLEHSGVAYMSNDRCVLRAGDAAATVRGLPTFISITRRGLDACPDVRARLFALRPDLAKADAASVGFTPDLFVELFSVPRTASASLAAFLFPRVTANAERLVLHRLSPADALAQFRAGLFRAVQPTVLGDVFASASTRGRTPWETAETAGRWVSAHLPCFAVELGGDRPPTAEDCAALLDRVTTSD